jgi:hypothetical protein
MTINRREVMVLGVAAAIIPAIPAFAMEPPNIAERFCQHLAKLGVTPVFNEEDAEFGKVGAKITSLTPSGALLIQRHVDWADPIVDGVPQKTDDRHIESCLAALAANIATSIYPTTEIKTYSLWVPPRDKYDGDLVSHGHMRLRFLRSYMLLTDQDGFFNGEEVMLNRIDILFPATGV